MANYRQIHTKIWRDNWFLELDTDEKLLFIYLFSNDNSNLAGIYELNERIIQLETGLDKTRIREILNKFKLANKVHFQDGIVWIVNMQKYHSNAGTKVQKNIESIILDLPDCEIKQKYCIANNIQLENTLSNSTDTLSYSKSNSKSNSKSESKSNESDEIWLSFSAAFQELTNIKPKPTPPVVAMLTKFQELSVTVDEYRKAIQEMQTGNYTISTMTSPEKWVMNNRTNGSKKTVSYKPAKSISPELDEILKDAPIFAEDVK
jgi:hypothetical protein